MQCPPECAIAGQPLSRAHLCAHIAAGIPSVIKYDEIRKLPKRVDFIDPALRTISTRAIATGAPFLFMPCTYKDNAFMPREEYKINVFGIMPCGTKTLVILENVPLYLLVLATDTDNQPILSNDASTRKTLDGFKTLINGFLSGCSFAGVSYVPLFIDDRFTDKPAIWLRYDFVIAADRASALRILVAKNNEHATLSRPLFKLASNDDGQNVLIYKYLRESCANAADWNYISKYTVDPNPVIVDEYKNAQPDRIPKFFMDGANYKPDTRDGLNAVSTACEFVLHVNARDFIPLDTTTRAVVERANPTLVQALDRDNTINCTWDIETWKQQDSGAPPVVGDTFDLFDIGCAFAWTHKAKPFLTIACIKHEVAPIAGTDIAIICGDEKRVCMAFAEVFSRFNPEMLATFNGAAFDTPLYREKMSSYGKMIFMRNKFSALTGWRNDDAKKIMKYNFTASKIKIDATTDHELPCVMMFPGFIDIDILPIFMKMYPRSEVRKAAALNFFLAENKLPSKEDMPYQRMFRIYERAMALEKANKNCHCADFATPNKCCERCPPIVRDIDAVDGNINNLIPELFNANGQRLCCCCGMRARNVKDMTDVAYYCVVDCVRPHQLLHKCAIFLEKKEISNLAYLPLYESYYRADGLKVRNFVGATMCERGIAFSNGRLRREVWEKDHYPGAYVFTPIYGLNKRRPVAGLDFSSLYPSIMMCHNISPDRLVWRREEADHWAALGYPVHHIGPFEVERGEKKGDPSNTKYMVEAWVIGHSGIVESIDTLVIESYIKKHTYKCLDKTTIAIRPTDTPPVGAKRTGFVAQPVRGRAPLPNERMGACSLAGSRLFARRVPAKAQWKKLEEVLEKMEKLSVKTYEHDGTTYNLENMDYDIAKQKMRQNALKLIGNTIYGVLGSNMSELYKVVIAGGITTQGQFYIKKVAEFVRVRGFEIQYGDTDSIYLIAPESAFIECDASHENAVRAIENAEYDTEDNRTRALDAEFEAYATRMIHITMRVMDEIKEEISDYLREFNNTTYMNMAYEEVGFPSAFFGFKKYCMNPHMSEVNFNRRDKDLMVKGIEIIKQGQAIIAKELGWAFIRAVLSLKNKLSLFDLARDMLTNVYREKRPIGDFVLSARYKKDKQNTAVLKFVERMTQMYQLTGNSLYEPPENGDKFQYVVVAKPQAYTMRGTMIKQSKGDVMEFVRVLQHFEPTGEMTIDTGYYVDPGIIGILSRFISYYEGFHPRGWPADGDPKVFDSRCIDAASNYLKEVWYKTIGFDKTAARVQGQQLRSAYTATSRVISTCIDSIPVVGAFFDEFETIETPREIMARVNEQIKEYIDAGAAARTITAKRVIKAADAAGINIHKMNNAYNNSRGRGTIALILRHLDGRIQDTLAQLHTIARTMPEIIHHYDMARTQTLQQSADELSINTLVSSDNIEIIAEFNNLVRVLRSYNAVAEQQKTLGMVICETRARSVGAIAEPTESPELMAYKESLKVGSDDLLSCARVL